MKSLVIALLMVVVAVQAHSADDQNSTLRGKGKGVEQKKAEIIRRIEERITNSKLEITCVQSATSHDELKACREKYKPRHNQGQGRNQQP